MANIHQNETLASNGDKPVKIPDNTANAKMTIRPPNHSDNVPPSKDVVKYP